MTEESIEELANRLYAEGMKYDLKQDKSFAAASIARANFEEAAALGHRAAARALAHMVYEGRGGPQHRERALLRLWSAFKHGDQDALEELGDLLASYGEQLETPAESKAAAAVSELIGNLDAALSKVSSYMHQLALAMPQAAVESGPPKSAL